MEWAPLIIPFIAAILLKTYFKKRVTWLEALIPILPTLIIIPSCKAVGQSSLTNDTEYWGSNVVEVRYYEDWNEYIHEICTRTVSCGKDCTTIEIYDCSYVRYHPPVYEILDTNNYTYDISEQDYYWLLKKLKSETVFVDLHRKYHSNDGDLYLTKWDGKESTLSPVVVEKTYENRVAVSNSVFNYPTVDPAINGLYDYPEVKDILDHPTIISSVIDNKINKADEILRKWNAKVGPTKQCRIWVLITENKPRSWGLEQEAYWKGGNKNELVVIISLNSYKVEWCHVFSWTDEDSLKIDIRDHIELAQEFNPIEVANYIGENVYDRFVRKQFSEFSYLKVAVPVWVHVINWILTILSTLAISIFVIENEYNINNDPLSKERWMLW